MMNVVPVTDSRVEVEPITRTIRKRDGVTLQGFDTTKIKQAMSCAWQECFGSIDELAIQKIVHSVLTTLPDGTVDVETVQDAVEVALMRHGYFAVAKAYILYRQKRTEARALRGKKPDPKAVSEYIHASKYARYRPELGRREVYAETVTRVEEMHINRFPKFQDEIQQAFDLVREQRVLPSMRSMQFGGAAILSNNNRLYNCSFSLIDRLEAFSEAMFLLLCGCGVGYSVQFDHVESLPLVGYVDPKKIRHYVIADSIEGWADALKALLQSYQDNVYLEISYHLIRPAGTPLKTSGGRAPGHMQLKDSLERIRKVLDAAQGRKLRPIECHRIMCHAADAVLSGGIRRSAMICLFSLDDSEMMNVKTGNWYVNEPWLSNANNSVVLKRDDVRKKQFQRIFAMTKQWGEPGFFFTNSYDHGTNPCFHPDTRLWTSDGYVRMIDLFNSGNALTVLADRRPGRDDDLSATMGVVALPATNVVLTQHDVEVYDLVTEHGYTVRVTANHAFPTPQGRKELRQLEVGDTLYLPSGEGLFGSKGTVEEGFVLGAYVGDGATVHDDGEAFVDVWEQDFDSLDWIGEAVNGIVQKVATHRGGRVYGPMGWIDRAVSDNGVESKRIGGVRLYRWFEELSDGDVRSLKARVLEAVWRGSREFVTGYLRGLFFTDGFVLLSGKDSGATLSLRLAQANEDLLKDVQVLLSMFGIVSRIYPRHEAGLRPLPDGHGGTKDYDCKATFELVISRPNVIVFRDKIGLDGWKKDTLDTYLRLRGESCRKPERFIARIKEIRAAGRSDVYCLTQPETNVVTANGIVTGQCAEIGLNPKLVIDKKVQHKLADRGIEVKVGQTFTGWAFCNLCEINAAKLTSLDDFLQAARAATLIGTLQASYTDMPYLGWVSETIAEREALLGIGMTGMLDAPDVACNPEYQARVAKQIKIWNAEFAGWLGIQPASRTTCVKPSGTTSLELGCVASGHHAHHARRYIRRVTADELEFVFQAFKTANPHMCVRKPDGKWVIEFPVEAPPGALIKKDLTAIEFLDMVKSTQQNWVVPGTASENYSPGLTHNVSNTVTVHPDDWDKVAAYLWENREYFTGVSMLPASGDKDFAFAPNEEIQTEADEVRWNTILAHYKQVDYAALQEGSDGTDLIGELACAGGACSII